MKRAKVPPALLVNISQLGSIHPLSPARHLSFGCLGLTGILIQNVSGSFGPMLGELDAGGKNLEKIPLSDAMYYLKHLKLPQTK